MSLRALYDVPAPAKLNTFLHIVGRRPDGYHILQSAFMLIDWCDTLHFELRPNGAISREDLGPTLPPDDLIIRAAVALQTHTGCTLGCHIQVEKRIPAQAGMGGGSSDAASCLLALNRLWRLKLPVATLSQIGLTLGADVPFFLCGHSAWVEGIGERITPLCGADAFADAEFVVIKPPQGLDTGAIFSSPDLHRHTASATLAGFAADQFGFGRNDLQPVAEALCPAVSEVIQWLSDLGLAGRMTGSGSAVFALLPDARFDLPEAPAAWRVRRCGNLNVHPLARWADS